MTLECWNYKKFDSEQKILHLVPMTFKWPWGDLEWPWGAEIKVTLQTVFTIIGHWINPVWPWSDLELTSRSTSISPFSILRMDRWTFQSKICIWPWNDLHDLDMTFIGLANGNIAMKQVLTKYCCFCYFHPKQHQKMLYMGILSVADKLRFVTPL